MAIICLSAGHGNSDPGAVGNGLREADLTGDICERVATKLSSYICDVYLVPRTDDLQFRANYANGVKSVAFISIHCNSAAGTDGEGFESYIYPSTGTASPALQKILHEAVVAYLLPLGVADRGRKTANFGVLRMTTMPACLLECLFVNNPIDAAWLKNDSFLDGLANAIAWGIVQALGLELKQPDATVEAIRALQAKGIIVSPEYWLLYAKKGEVCRGEWVADLIRNLADKIKG
jgi:N-acetylmuramoyl-L-alanine amidase